MVVSLHAVMLKDYWTSSDRLDCPRNLSQSMHIVMQIILPNLGLNQAHASNIWELCAPWYFDCFTTGTEVIYHIVVGCWVKISYTFYITVCGLR